MSLFIFVSRLEQSIGQSLILCPQLLNFHHAFCFKLTHFYLIFDYRFFKTGHLSIEFLAHKLKLISKNSFKSFISVIRSALPHLVF